MFLDKYKCKSIHEFCAKTEFKNFLSSVVDNNFLNLLIQGSIGSGKTTLLNLLTNDYIKTHELKPCDVLHISHLHEQGIQYYRTEIKTFCQLPTNNKKKLIVVDDVEMIEKLCQDVLTGFMDRWGYNFHLLCSTSDISKISEGLLARLIGVLIPQPNLNEIRTSLQTINSMEGFNISNEVLDQMIVTSEFSLRTCYHFMEKIYYSHYDSHTNSYLHIDSTELNELSTTISSDEFLKFTNSCKEQDFLLMRQHIITILDKGFSMIDILEDYFLFVKQTKYIEEKDKYELFKIISNFIMIFHTLHEESIEFYIMGKQIADYFLSK
jgi:DNA polymerase III delta prime subunit